MFPFSYFTPNTVPPSCLLSNALKMPHLMCLCLPCCSGGDWNSLCEMIFAVIKESHSVDLTVLMESRNCPSSPNSLTGLVTAAGGAQKHSYCQEGYVSWFHLQRCCLLNRLWCMRNGRMETGKTKYSAESRTSSKIIKQARGCGLQTSEFSEYLPKM